MKILLIILISVFNIYAKDIKELDLNKQIDSIEKFKPYCQSSLKYCYNISSILPLGWSNNSLFAYLVSNEAISSYSGEFFLLNLL